jgi:hypothetical protein
MRTLTLLGAVLFVLPAIAAEGDFKAMFAKQWQVAKEFTLAVAEAMLADGYGFKANPEELSFGQLMIHIAAQNSDSCASATGTKPLARLSSGAWPAQTDKQTAIKFLTDSFDKCATEIDAMPPEQWNKEVVCVHAHGASSDRPKSPRGRLDALRAQIETNSKASRCSRARVPLLVFRGRGFIARRFGLKRQFPLNVL